MKRDRPRNDGFQLTLDGDIAAPPQRAAVIGEVIDLKGNATQDRKLLGDQQVREQLRRDQQDRKVCKQLADQQERKVFGDLNARILRKRRTTSTAAVAASSSSSSSSNSSSESDEELEVLQAWTPTVAPSKPDKAGRA